jgi:hypothetical protein
MRSIVIAVLVAACDAPSTAPFDPAAVVTGIYTMTATTLKDTCDPPRFTGSVTSSIFSNSEAISFFFQEQPNTIEHEALTAANGYAARIPPAGKTIYACGSGGSLSFDFTLTKTDARSLDIAEDDVWTIVSPCVPYREDVPRASCAASRTLHYELVEACSAPCKIVRGGPTAQLTCSCPEHAATPGVSTL